MKKVIFVNGVCTWIIICLISVRIWRPYGARKVNRIGVQCFGVTPLEQFCVNAKNIDVSAFAGMESLKEIHIRGGVEHMRWEHLQCCRNRNNLSGRN